MLIKNMMEDLGDEAISTAVPIPNVRLSVLNSPRVYPGHWPPGALLQQRNPYVSLN